MDAKTTTWDDGWDAEDMTWDDADGRYPVAAGEGDMWSADLGRYKARGSEWLVKEITDDNKPSGSEQRG